MKLTDTILFVLAFCFFVIGIHQAMVVGMAESYWIFMFSLLPLFLYGYRKNKAQEKSPNTVKGKNSSKKKHQKHG